MTSSVYTLGTVAVTNNAVAVTGTDTAWEMSLVTGGVFSFGGMAIPIASVESDTALTLAYPWPGTSASGSYAIARETSAAVRAVWSADRVAKLLTKPWGIGVVPDGRGTLAQRDALNPMPTEKFAWLREEVGFDPAYYFKLPSGWIGPYPFYGGQGEPGPAGVLNWKSAGWATATNYVVNDGLSRNGSSYRCKVNHLSAAATEPGVGLNWNTVWDVTAAKGTDGAGYRTMGAYSNVTAYLKNDVVRDAGSSWVALQSTTGNPPPALPATANAHWELLAQKGADGAGAITSVNGTSSGAVIVDQASVDGQSTLVTTRGDAAYVILATDRHVLLTASLTVGRVWQLPAASTYRAGRRLVVRDAVGGISSTNTLTIQRAGTDTVDGATTLVLDAPWEGAELVSNGADAWSVMTVAAGNTKARRRRSLGLDDTTVAAAVGDTFKWNGSIWVPAKAREVLTAARNYYVRLDGIDTNDGLSNSSGGAFLTIAKALQVATSLDGSIYNVAINVGAGTWTSPVFLPQFTGSGSWTLTGDITTPANVLLNVTGAAVTASAINSTWRVRGFKVSATTIGIQSTVGATLLYGNIDFGACGTAHVGVANGASASAIQTTSISGSALIHWYVTGASTLFDQGWSIPISGTPNFANAFIQIDSNSTAVINQNTFTGSATGKRYNATLNSVVNVNGAGASYLPGDVAGTATTGSQYA